LGPRQGDQIEWMFVYRTIVFPWAVFENYRSIPNFWATFYHGTTNKCGLHFGRFFHKLIWSARTCFSGKCFVELAPVCPPRFNLEALPAATWITTTCQTTKSWKLSAHN
jgi:hypothetical protein